MFQFLLNVTRFLVLFWKLPQIRTSNFRKVVQQHTEGMVGSIIWVLLAIYLSLQQWKNFENQLKLTKLSPWVWCSNFLGHSVHRVRATANIWRCGTLLFWFTEHIYPSSVVDGVVGGRVDPQSLARRDMSDMADNAIVVVHLSTPAWTTVIFHYNHHNYTVSGKRDRHYFGRNFDKFWQLFIIFGMNDPDNPYDWKIVKCPINHRGNTNIYQYLHDTT